MTPKTDSEILTHYILSAGMDPEDDELREACEQVQGYKVYHFGVRTEELKTAIFEAMRKITNNYLDNLGKHV